MSGHDRRIGPGGGHGPIRLILAGAGNRGRTYADYAASTGLADVVAIAEPDPERAAAAIARHPGAELVDDWRGLVTRPRFADAVIVATQDAHHLEPALAFTELGYHLLLEKPIATREEDVHAIIEAAERADIMLAVCHVLRYTPYTRALREMLDEGVIGDVISVEHLEPVGWWHHAHSYVRGNWRREADATPMILAKSSHDLDWLGYIVGRPVRKVQSFGGLKHFRHDQRPAAAADRCVDCPLSQRCPYSATRLYLGCLGDPVRERWPLGVVTSARTPEGVLAALREGPYGRCVYDSDNDVVDHQVVNLEYEGGATVSFTMTAFTEYAQRKTRIFGSHGQLDGDGVTITLTDFRTGDRSERQVGLEGPDAGTGHGGGDERLVDAFLDALVTGDRTRILSDPRSSLESHVVAWAAERSRRGDTVEMIHRGDAATPDAGVPASDNSSLVPASP